MLIKMIDDDDDEADPGPMPQLEDMNPYYPCVLNWKPRTRRRPS